MAKKSGKSKGTRSARGGKARATARPPKAKRVFSELERNILKSKGVAQAQIAKLIQKGIRCRNDFVEVGDAATLAEFAGLPLETAEKVMAWARGGATAEAKNIVVESGDIVHCVYCKTKQPVDYKPGDLCVSCGKQAEPVLACFWCSSSGPGKFCRQCGAEFVPTADLPLAILLKREGLPRDEIPAKLQKMSAADKQLLWGRVRRG